ncbi:MAG TPA: alpha/beta hydrolase [Acidimicrobiia bacterium]|nr:alpha/beta hydrolase [Acidimicrobiia bacterium]
MDSGGLHIETQGSGAPPIVFTHGFARDGRAWARQVAALAEDHLTVTWDLRGHGDSPAPPGDYTRESALADLRLVVEGATAEGRGPAVLVGHSLGGYLSLAYALAWPETVAGLVLLSTGPGFRNPDSMVAYNRTIARAAAAGNVAPNVAEVAVHRDAMVIDRLAEITCPAVMVSGADDLPIYQTGAKYLSERLASARLIVIDGAGHEPHLDRPDEVTAAVRAHPALVAARN